MGLNKVSHIPGGLEGCLLVQAYTHAQDRLERVLGILSSLAEYEVQSMQKVKGDEFVNCLNCQCVLQTTWRSIGKGQKLY